jgi:hypothetical protein
MITIGIFCTLEHNLLSPCLHSMLFMWFVFVVACFAVECSAILAV